MDRDLVNSFFDEDQGDDENGTGHFWETSQSGHFAIFTVPDYYEPLPDIPSILNHSIMSLQDMYDWMRDFINEDRIIGATNDQSFLRVSCDMCDATFVTKGLWYCNRFTDIDLCPSCRKLPEGICMMQSPYGENVLKPPRLKPSLPRISLKCFQCNNTAFDTPGQWRIVKGYDARSLCGNCTAPTWGQLYAKIWDAEDLINENQRIEENNFGSLLDWVPVLSCNVSNAHVLINLNFKSPYFNRVALAERRPEIPIKGINFIVLYDDFPTVCERLQSKAENLELILQNTGDNIGGGLNSPIYQLIMENDFPDNR